MKSFLTFVLVLSCLAIDTDAQTKTTLKPITTKLIATSLTPKLTTLKPTVTTTKVTTSKMMTTLKSTLKTTTVKPTTQKISTVITTVKITTRKINATTMTFKPNSSMTTTKTVTTTASATQIFKICQDINSTATSGSIQLLDGITPEETTPPKKCAFTIIAPTDHKVQMSCSVVNLTKIFISYNASGNTFAINSSSLIFDGTLDLNFFNVIIPNRVYTSYNNTMTATYRVVNASDKFECKWTTIKAVTTSNFEWCRDSETTAANGTMKTPYESLSTLQNAVESGTTITELSRVCPFFINSSPNHQVQVSCSLNSSFSQYFILISFADIVSLPYRSKLNMSAALNGTRIELLSAQLVPDASVDCNWITFTTSNTTMEKANQCVHVESTVSNGIITPLANNSGSNICLFSVIAPLGQRIQMSCTVLNFTFGYLQITATSEITDRTRILNRVYTSVTNRIDTVSSVKNDDWFQCNWTMVKFPTTAEFKLCRDGEATVAGTIQSFSNKTVEYSIVCRFIIIAPSNKRVQMYCPAIIVASGITTAEIGLFEYYPFPSTIAFPLIVNRTYTSNGNEMVLLASDSNSLRFNCTWTFV